MQCKLCQVSLANGSLASHLETRHDVQHCYLGEAVCPVAPASYEARYMPATDKWLCPVPDCPQGRERKRCNSKANLWSRFAHCHLQGAVQIGGHCPPKCRFCELQTRVSGSGKWLCPVPDCPQGREGKRCSSKANLWSHVAHCHLQGAVRIGGHCPPKWRFCELQTRVSGSVRHKRTDKCRKLAAQRWR